MAAPLFTIGIGSSIAGGVLGAQGSLLQGQSMAAMYNYQAAVSKFNQQIANQNAEYTMNAGQAQAAQAGMATRAQIGQTKAAEGAGNIAVGKGSSADVLSSEREIGQINTANILNNAARVAYGYKVGAVEAGAQSNIYSAAAPVSLESGEIGALGSLISGASSVATKWTQGFGAGLGGTSGSPGLGAPPIPPVDVG